MFRSPRRRQRDGNDHRHRGRSDPTAGRNSKSTAGAAATTVVGTEAAARKNMERNRKEFNYPKDGQFVTPIEHSLLYSMLKEPTVYPRDVVIQHVQEEDYEQYLYYTIANKNWQENDDGGHQHPLASYAQLTALLGLAAEHYAPPLSEEERELRRREQAHRDSAFTTEFRDTSSASKSEAKDSSSNSDLVADVTKALGKVVLQCVVRYATEHELDRETEVNELLEPLTRYVQRRNAQAELKGIAGLYAGYTATLLTANPIPAMAGLAVWTTQVTSRDTEMRNFETMRKETSRRANVETTGLLDEADDV